ncbi:MAG: ATP-binding protein [Candidatus Thermoplasmatota archaeon]
MPDARDKRLLLLDVIQRLNDRLHEAGISDESFSLVADGLREMSGADYAAVVLLDIDGMHMRLVGASGVREVSPADFGAYVPDISMRSMMAEGSRSNALVWESLDKAPPAARQIMEKYGASSAMVISVVFRGKVLGYLVLANKDGRPAFDADAESAAMSLADYMGMAVDSARSESMVRRSEEENHRILSIAPIGIMSLDPKGIIQSVNMQMLKVFERKAEGDLVGTSIFEIPAVHRSGLDALVIQGMEGHPAEKVDLHYVPRQDKAFYLHVKVAPLLSERGEVEDVVLVAMDTTSKVRLESQLERSYEKLTQTYQELERVTKMKTQFIDVVSHELRTPLTVMRGYVDLVEGEYGPKLDQRFAQRLKIIKANTDKLYALVESMLDISRLEKGTLEIHPEPVRVDAILEDVVGDRAKDAEEKKQSMSLSVDGAIPVVMADRRRMRDVFNNLIDNAIKYTEEGGRIQVGCRDEGRIVHAWVKDNGIGIPLENLGRIFDRFYIVAKDDLAHQVDRIGLSLPIAKGIVESHGGRLWVESQVGKGSVFHVDLPKEQSK